MEDGDPATATKRARRLYDKRRRRRAQTFANSAAHLARTCLELRVSTLLIGGLRGIAHDKPSRGNSNMWGYRELKQRLTVTAENNGIALFEIPKDDTSSREPVNEKKHPSARRGQGASASQSAQLHTNSEQSGIS